ncbi:hypothetical protein VNO80_00386 [Phaseolus coccineus]|uniref:TIR domain-containing protein n=1 Tax=Phaseolus coccineus TaxID=3886 RepID=A0AAN9P3V5_PHACN
MQSVVNPMCFQVSHRIKYVVIICLVLVRFSTCSNYSSQIVLDVFVSFRSVDDCRGFLSLSLSFRVVDVRLGSRSNFIEEFLQKQISFLDCNIQKGEELFEAPLTSSVFPSDTLQSKYDVFVSFRGPDVREGVERRRTKMQSVVNPMCFRVSHRIKYVVFICLLFVTSSTCSNDTSQIKYDVFVSFIGVDVRRGFLSHLIEAFSQKQIAFFADDNIQKGEELSEALLGATEESLIPLVIFSENYASSRWCLLELEKILECRRKNGQIVMPIFYEVDPSDVRHQRRTYGDAFVKHERSYSLIIVQRWRSALTESANLSEFHSSIFCSL